jgi:hypothetical protein
MYSSAGRPGVFNKTVTVTSNAAEPSKVLTIKGSVLTKDEIKPTLTAAQLAQSPRLVVDKNTHDFGKMETGQQPTARFTVKNTGKTPLVLVRFGRRGPSPAEALPCHRRKYQTWLCP